MDIKNISIIPLVILTVLHCIGEVAGQNPAACSKRCTNKRAYLSRYSFSITYLDNSFRACYSKCISPTQTGHISWNMGTTAPTTKRQIIYTVPTRPTTKRPIIYTVPTRPTTKWPIIYTVPTRPTTKRPIIYTFPTRPTTKWPIVYTVPTRPTTKKPIIYTLPPVVTTRAPPFTWAPPQPTWIPVATRPPSPYGCGYRRQFTSRIIGGQPSAACEFPWMVTVRVPSDVCGGVILDKRHVLTAAHCFTSLNPNEVTVKVGSSSLSQLRAVKVQKVNVHPMHNSFKDYDVAVLTLAQDLIIGACIAPICLPTLQQNAITMSECVVTGWGVLDPTLVDRTQPDTLQKITVPIVRDDLCTAAYGPNLFNDLKICAGDYDQGLKDSCKGDSGGPLMCRNQNGPFSVFGLVSFGKLCAKPHYPGVYTRVNHPQIMKYILEKINEPYF